MRVQFNNFKCYENKTFDLGENGLILISGKSGIGKCLAKGTKVLLYNGLIKNVEHLNQTDLLMGDDETPRKILSMCQGTGVLYRIIPEYGRPFIVNDEHILTLIDKKPDLHLSEETKMYKLEWSESGKKRYEWFNTITDGLRNLLKLPRNRIYDIPIKEYLELENPESHIVHKYISKFPNEKEVLVPYIYGTNDLWEYKIIPQKYKIAPFYQRRALFAGIIDAAGELVFRKKHFFKIYLTDDILIEDIEFVANSIGFITEYYNKHLFIYGDFTQLSLNLFDKKELKCFKDVFKQKFKIEKYSLSSEYFGFELSDNGRFLLGDFTITHNSSILHGINYGLFGKNTKIVSHGKTSSSVIIEYDKLKIERCSRPKKLKVYYDDHLFEDDAGQNIIYKIFGKTFDISGYIAQNSIGSFLNMSPNEKLEFLERFSFKDIDIINIKEKIKKEIDKLDKEIIEITTKIESNNLFLDNISNSLPEKVNNPFENKNFESSKSKLLIKLQNRKTKLINTQNKIKKYTEYKFKLINYENNKKQEIHLNELLSNNCKKLNELPKGDINTLNKLYKEHLEYEKYLYSQQQIEYEKTNLSNLKETEIENCKKEILKNKEFVEKYEEYDFDENISCYENILKNVEQYEYLIKEKALLDYNAVSLEKYNTDKIQTLNKLDNLKNLKESSKIFKCPKCFTFIKFDDDRNLYILNCEANLQTKIQSNKSINENDIDDEISELSDKLSKLELNTKKEEIKSSKYNDLNKNIDAIYNNIKSEYELEKLPSKTELKNNIKTLISTKSIVDEKKKKINELELKLEKNDFPNLEKLENEITLKIKKLVHLNPPKKSKEKIYQELETLKNAEKIEKELLEENETLLFKLEEIKSTFEYLDEIKNINECDDKIKELNSELENTNKELVEYSTIEKNILEYEEYIKTFTKYTDLQKTINNLKNKEDGLKKEYIALTTLKSKVAEAESLSISNIISIINSHVQIYLNEFFEENVLIATLVSFKETSKTMKPQINIKIDYKNNEIDLNSLSGGELARLNLAYTLALNEIFNTPILMLDECTSSLDEILTNKVIDVIRDNCKDKLIIIIAHQCVNGIFDRVIEL